MSTTGREAATAEQAQVPGITRIDLQRQDLSAAGRGGHPEPRRDQRRSPGDPAQASGRGDHLRPRGVARVSDRRHAREDVQRRRGFDRPGRDGSRSQERGRGQRRRACDLRHREGQAFHRFGRGLSGTVKEVEKGAQTVRAAREPFEQHTPGAAVGVENPDARRPGMYARNRCEVNFASAGRAGAGRVGERRGEEAVGPFLGEAARVGEHQVDFGVAHLEPG
jgi:hypothetical protein